VTLTGFSGCIRNGGRAGPLSVGALKNALDAKKRADEELAAAKARGATKSEIAKMDLAADDAGRTVGDRMAEYDDATAGPDDKKAWNDIEWRAKARGNPA